MNKVLIIAGSPEPEMSFLTNYGYTDAVIIAVDKGLEICNRLALLPTCIIGDFDSVDKDVLSLYDDNLKKTFPAEKNESDLQLAVEYAYSQYPGLPVTILNATKGRLDHTVFNVMVLFSNPGHISLEDSSGITTALPAGVTTITELKKGQVFSLIPFGECAGVSICNARYELQSVTLTTTSLSLSNISQGNTIISYDSGKLLLFSIK